MSVFSDFDKHLSPKERIFSWSIQRYTIELSTDTTFRKTEKYENWFLHRDGSGAFHHRTIADFIERTGKSFNEAVDSHVTEILEANNFNPETALPNDPESLSDSVKRPDVIPEKEIIEEVKASTREYNATHEEFPITVIPDNFVPELSRSGKIVLLSIDDVLVKHQKDERTPEFVKEKQNVANTVIHIQADGKGYILNAVGIKQAFRILVAFLLENNLFEDRQLVFLSDGAKEIKEYIQKFFSWRPYILILDWFHLAKRIKELISMCLKLYKDKKGPIIKKILNYLWVGDTDGAIAYIQSFKSSIIKNEKVHKELIAYLQRKKENICCHALRRLFNLRLSSNAAEKSNDIVVADRQKHNGMSWSFDGSGALAVLKAACKNNTLDLWITEKKISMSLKDSGWKMESNYAA